MTIRVLWSNIIIKSFQRSKMICGEFFFKWKNWSFAYAVYSSAWWIGWYCPFFKGLGAWGFNKKTQWLRQYLKDNYGELICRFAEQNRTEQNRTEQNRTILLLGILVSGY